MIAPSEHPRPALAATARRMRLAYLSRVLHDPELGTGGALETGGDEALERMEAMRAAMAADALASHYRWIFGHTPGGACPVYELSWLPAGDFASEQELSDIGGFYRAFGVSVGPMRERLDHMAIELEFLAYAAHMEAEAERGGSLSLRDVSRRAQRSFLRDHLGRWAPAFFERMEARAPAGFYRELARFGARCVAQLVEELEIEPALRVVVDSGALAEPAARDRMEARET